MKTYKFGNIEMMAKNSGYSSFQVAAKIVEKEGHGWRLPTIKELSYIHSIFYNLWQGELLVFPNDTSRKLYWSSSINSGNGCQILRFPDGYIGMASTVS